MPTSSQARVKTLNAAEDFEGSLRNPPVSVANRKALTIPSVVVCDVNSLPEAGQVGNSGAWKQQFSQPTELSDVRQLQLVAPSQDATNQMIRRPTEKNDQFQPWGGAIGQKNREEIQSMEKFLRDESGKINPSNLRHLGSFSSLTDQENYKHIEIQGIPIDAEGASYTFKSRNTLSNKPCNNSVDNPSLMAGDSSLNDQDMIKEVLCCQESQLKHPPSINVNEGETNSCYSSGCGVTQLAQPGSILNIQEIHGQRSGSGNKRPDFEYMYFRPIEPLPDITVSRESVLSSDEGKGKAGRTTPVSQESLIQQSQRQESAVSSTEIKHSDIPTIRQTALPPLQSVETDIKTPACLPKKENSKRHLKPSPFWSPWRSFPKNSAKGHDARAITVKNTLEKRNAIIRALNSSVTEKASVNYHDGEDMVGMVHQTSRSELMDRDNAVEELPASVLPSFRRFAALGRRNRLTGRSNRWIRCRGPPRQLIRPPVRPCMWDLTLRYGKAVNLRGAMTVRGRTLNEVPVVKPYHIWAMQQANYLQEECFAQDALGPWRGFPGRMPGLRNTQTDPSISLNENIASPPNEDNNTLPDQLRVQFPDTDACNTPTASGILDTTKDQISDVPGDDSKHSQGDAGETDFSSNKPDAEVKPCTEQISTKTVSEGQLDAVTRSLEEISLANAQHEGDLNVAHSQGFQQMIYDGWASMFPDMVYADFSRVNGRTQSAVVSKYQQTGVSWGRTSHITKPTGKYLQGETPKVSDQPVNASAQEMKQSVTTKNKQRSTSRVQSHTKKHGNLSKTSSPNGVTKKKAPLSESALPSTEGAPQAGGDICVFDAAQAMMGTIDKNKSEDFSIKLQAMPTVPPPKAENMGPKINPFHRKMGEMKAVWEQEGNDESQDDYGESDSEDSVDDVVAHPEIRYGVFHLKKYRMLPMRKTMPPLQPKKLCFTCPFPNCTHEEVKTGLETNTRLKIKSLQFDPIYMQDNESGNARKSRWIIELPSDAGSHFLLMNGFHLRNAYINVRRLDDVHREEVRAFELYRDICLHTARKKQQRRRYSRRVSYAALRLRAK